MIIEMKEIKQVKWNEWHSNPDNCFIYFADTRVIQ